MDTRTFPTCLYVACLVNDWVIYGCRLATTVMKYTVGIITKELSSWMRTGNPVSWLIPGFGIAPGIPSKTSWNTSKANPSCLCDMFEVPSLHAWSSPYLNWMLTQTSKHWWLPRGEITPQFFSAQVGVPPSQKPTILLLVVIHVIPFLIIQYQRFWTSIEPIEPTVNIQNVKTKKSMKRSTMDYRGPAMSTWLYLRN